MNCFRVYFRESQSIIVGKLHRIQITFNTLVCSVAFTFCHGWGLFLRSNLGSGQNTLIKAHPPFLMHARLSNKILHLRYVRVHHTGSEDGNRSEGGSKARNDENWHHLDDNKRERYQNNFYTKVRKYCTKNSRLDAV